MYCKKIAIPECGPNVTPSSLRHSEHDEYHSFGVSWQESDLFGHIWTVFGWLVLFQVVVGMQNAAVSYFLVGIKLKQVRYALRIGDTGHIYRHGFSMIQLIHLIETFMSMYDIY